MSLLLLLFIMLLERHSQRNGSKQPKKLKVRDILFQGYLNKHHTNFVLCFALIVL